MPVLPQTAYFPIAPDWICEVLSPSTEDHDRFQKMPIYAREGVRHVWLLDPIAGTLEAFWLDADRQLKPTRTYVGDMVVRVEPFEAIELELSIFWLQ